VAGALLPMIQIGLIDSWVAFVIIVREFAISGLRSFAAAEGEVIPAGTFGKQKLVIQVVALVWRLLAASATAENLPGGGLGDALRVLLDLWPFAIGLAVLWTVGSGLEYIWRAWPLLRSSWAPRERGKAEG
jgi:CDP-diacylglycerol--glycerol-3-phosphate 3-phosphatidyltransferase